MTRVAPEVARPTSGGSRFLATSVGFVAGKGMALGVGFLFWLLAAHAADVDDVGLAAGAVSLMMLVTQLAIAGTGSAFILNHRAHRDQVHRLLDASVTLVLLTSTLAAVGALAIVALALDGLRPVATDPTFAVLFIAITALGTLGILLDHVSVALQRGEQVLVRNTCGGLLTAAPLLLPPLTGWELSAQRLFALWLLGGAAAVAVAGAQLSRELAGYRYRPCLNRSLVATILRSGVPNHALTLVERAPNLLLPIVVTEVLSPRANAYWYVAWMMAWAVLVVPVSIGTTLLAQVSSATAALASDVRRAARTGLGLGLLAATSVAVVGGPVLGLMGRDFRTEGTGPLRVLLLALVPVLALQIYFAVCRATRRLPEALATGALGGLTALTAAALVGGDRGLVGMAWAWVAVQTVFGAWAAVRVARLMWTLPSSPDDGEDRQVDAGRRRGRRQRISA